ncbi:MAG TPA: Sec-independent protein translocase protein TatB [Burkholderiales bacterium]|jgi:sec-independent protein translocase protein TatB|nr:Sec-independent protein translocase protein TatB [Burkholderiales bacterium]
MFDIGFSELLVIGIVALVVIGPERLPKVARTAGHLFGRIQRYAAGVKADIAREMQLDDLHQFKSEIENTARSVEASIQQEVSLAEQEIKVLAEETKRIDEVPTYEGMTTRGTGSSEFSSVSEAVESTLDSEPSPQMELALDADVPSKPASQ